MKHVDGYARNQSFITTLDEMVHPHAMVRIIDAFVDALDLSEFKLTNLVLNS